MSKFLANQVALVTGGGRRTGRDIAIALAQAGAQVHITYRSDREAAEATAAELAALQSGSRAWQCDGTDEKAVEQTVKQLQTGAGAIDVLVNAVGRFLAKPLDEVTPDEWRATLDGTVTTTFLMGQAILPIMRSQNYGRVVNIADAGADLPGPWRTVAPYMVGKAGILMLTKSWAQHYGPYGITVNAVSPGILENSITKPSIEVIPVRRFTPTAAIARAVLQFADPAAKDVTGANLKVGGGWHM